jgi:hypothetical protein
MAGTAIRVAVVHAPALRGREEQLLGPALQAPQTPRQLGIKRDLTPPAVALRQLDDLDPAAALIVGFVGVGAAHAQHGPARARSEILAAPLAQLAPSRPSRRGGVEQQPVAVTRGREHRGELLIAEGPRLARAALERG